MISVDKNATYPPAVDDLKEGDQLPAEELRQVQFLNYVIERDHRFLKRRINPGLGFGAFNPAPRTILGYEAMHMIRKGRIDNVKKGDVMGQISFIDIVGISLIKEERVIEQ